MVVFGCVWWYYIEQPSFTVSINVCMNKFKHYSLQSIPLFILVFANCFHMIIVDLTTAFIENKLYKNNRNAMLSKSPVLRALNMIQYDIFSHTLAKLIYE